MIRIISGEFFQLPVLLPFYRHLVKVFFMLMQNGLCLVLVSSLKLR